MLKNKRKFHTLIILAGILIFTSCSTRRKLVDYPVKPMPAGKIMRKVNKESPDYKHYEARKMVLSYYNNDDRASFSGQFSIDRDDYILLTLRKLNMPVGRAMLSPDSLKVVNYFEKYFIDEGISSLQEVLGFDIDYQMMEALLTADISKLVDESFFEKELTSYIDSNMYRIDSQFKSKIDKALSDGNEKRLSRYMRRMDDHEFISYNVWIDPRLFVIRRITFRNIKNHESINIAYDDFEQSGRSMFPQLIAVDFSSTLQQAGIKLKLTKPLLNKEKNFTFTIPEKYDQLKLLKQQ